MQVEQVGSGVPVIGQVVDVSLDLCCWLCRLELDRRLVGLGRYGHGRHVWHLYIFFKRLLRGVRHNNQS